MKKYIAFVAGLAAVVSALATNFAAAQNAGGGGYGYASTATGSAQPGAIHACPLVIPSGCAANGTDAYGCTIWDCSGRAQPPVPGQPPGGDNGDIIQFNNLVIQSVSLQTPPAEILAGYEYYMPTITNPVTNFQGVPGASGGAATTRQPTTQTNGQCFRFESRNTASGSAIQCPTPPMPNGASSSAPVTAQPQTGAIPSMPAQIYPWPNNAYRIQVSSDTRLFLRDRTPATLADFAPGDKINVFGFYNSDGTVQAIIVRNLSKPVVKTFFQLDNAELVSVSSTQAPAALVVVQRPSYPCYSFGASGAGQKQSFPCPLGLQSDTTSGGAAIKTPQALMPVWGLVRKYEVDVDARTILINRNRGGISVADLRQGDKLNIYGQIEGDTGPIDADIVRDLSQPPQVTDYEGRVTQVNPDGSFIIQTNNSTLVTVQNPIQAGATVKLTGLLDELQKVLSQVSRIVVSQPQTSPQPEPPAPVPLPMMQKQQ